MRSGRVLAFKWGSGGRTVFALISLPLLAIEHGCAIGIGGSGVGKASCGWRCAIVIGVA